MNIYELIAANTAALEANTAALLGGKAAATTNKPAAAETKAATTKTTKAAASKGPSREDMVTALTQVKEQFGAAEAKAIIKKLGAEKMADIDDDQIEKGFKLASAKLAAETATASDEDDGL